MNALDTLLQTTCPTVMLPRYETLPPLAEDGHRFLAAADGVYIEIRRPWLHLVHQVAACRLPYGEVPPVFNLNLPRRALAACLAEFVAQARASGPIETAAWCSYHPATQSLSLTPCRIHEASYGRVVYERPSATPDSLPCIDCHSHGDFPAFFSEDDNRDDLDDDVKLAFVVGTVQAEKPSIAMRLTGQSLNIDLSAWAASHLYDGSMFQPAINRHELRT